MKKQAFIKYHGIGNDFILIDNRRKDFQLSDKEIQLICDRHFGVGSDGLILLERSFGVDFKMIFYNPDATKDMMCGNGGRCIVAFARHIGIVKIKYKFEAPDGIHTAEVFEKLRRNKLNIKLSLLDVDNIVEYTDGQFINSGTAHFVSFVNNLSELDINTLGSKIRHDKRFSDIMGTNANFVEIIAPGKLNIRTFERGVEGETLACGTGITASAIAYVDRYNIQENPIIINAKGGELKVYYTKTPDNRYTNIFLEGFAEKVFEGVFFFER
ncbi:MAG: diaminopimelate epimerase [Bacteroidales bacterium]|nr:diaminopimelate epimerase [Bacteroidales bacterium]